MAENVTEPHSFRRMAEADSAASQQYVFSDDRHAGLIEFLSDRVELAAARVVDLGCGAGVITRGLSRACREVVGIDGNEDNVNLARSYAQEQGLANVEFMHARADDLPLASRSVDLLLLNGVLEWVGTNGRGENPRALQLVALREVLRVLRPGGLLYVGIENRFHPGTLLRDPHTRLPLVNALPRSAANRFARWYGGGDFQTYIYGHWQTAALLREAGFGCVDKYAPFPSYQFPAAFLRLGSRRETMADLDAIDTARIERVMRDSRRDDDVPASLRRLRRRASLGLLGLIAHDHAFIAGKG